MDDQYLHDKIHNLANAKRDKEDAQEREEKLLTEIYIYINDIYIKNENTNSNNNDDKS